MPINISVKTKIRVNGRDYASVDEMPADIRQAYERALASMNPNSTPGVVRRTLTRQIVFNGQTFATADQMPADVRQVYDRVIAAVDANGNGIPDVLELPSHGPDESHPILPPGPLPLSATPLGIMRKDSSGSWLVVAGVAIAVALLAFSLLGR